MGNIKTVAFWPNFQLSNAIQPDKVTINISFKSAAYIFKAKVRFLLV
jgi:hypothetical protein